MTTRKTLLDRVEIVSPCTADWNAMQGTDEVRFCSECRKYVYNLSEMTRREAEALLSTRRNQMCARLLRDLERQTITLESLPPIRLMSWKPGPVANAIVSALISIAPMGASLASAKVLSDHTHPFDSGAKRPLPAEMQAALAGVVSDENDTPIVGALVTITTESTGEILSQLTAEGGEFRFDGLDPRTYIVEVQHAGYRISKLHDVILYQGEVRRLDVGLEKLMVVMGAVGYVPLPLRILYQNSDRVVLARVGKPIGAPKESSNRATKTPLNVVKTIKGDGHKPALDVYLPDYDDRGDLIEGETILAFLERKTNSRSNDSAVSYQFVPHSESAKRLSPDELEKYLRRLDDLQTLLSNSGSQPTDIVEWLVRCAEDPITRREGAYELNASARREYWKSELERAAAAIRVRSPRDEEPFFASLLTDAQKSRLANAVLKSEEFSEGDFELIELFSLWNDVRLVPFLVSYLQRQLETAPRDAEPIMKSVADALDNDNVTELFDRYIDNASYEDLDVASEEDTDVDEKEADEVSSESENSEETSSTTDQEDTTPKLAPEAARQARVKMLRSFLAAVQAHMKTESVK
jgi:hypothetical protein